MRRRKNESHAGELSGEAAVGKRRRSEGRGWGPFSGGQLAFIIVAVAAVVGFPYAANAVVSGSNVFVTDATTGTRAAVMSQGAQKVAVTGKVNLGPTDSGNLNTAAMKLGQIFVGSNGRLAVDAAPIPTQLFQYTSEHLFSSQRCDLLVVPHGLAIIVTSIHLEGGGQQENFAAILAGSTSSQCGSGKVIERLDIPGNNVPNRTELDYPTGLGIGDGHNLNVFYDTPSNLRLTVGVFGYIVPSNLCTGDCQ
jgi:hypothetical protein